MSQTLSSLLPHFERLRQSVDDRIDKVLSGVEGAALREILVDGTRGGKRIRPLITLLACEAVGGREEQALDAAVAVELLHCASLIHDDIMDRSEMRRGRPTLHVRYDLPAAILAGDTLLALTFRLASRIPSRRRDALMAMFTDSFLELCEGQSDDVGLDGGSEVDPARHRRLVERKTARLVELAAGAGALLGGAEDRPVRCLRCFGFNVGMAFQAMDDLLDVTGDADITGKIPGADLRNERHTFLTIPHSFLDNVTVVGSVVAEYTQKAVSALDDLPVTPAKSCLLVLAESLMRRDR